MPIIKSAIKKAKQDERARKRNRNIRVSFRDAVKEVKKLAIAGDAKKTQEALKKAYSEIDRAAKRGVIHKNAASRRKSRLVAFIKEPKAAKKSESKKTTKKETLIEDKPDSKETATDKKETVEEEK